MTDFAFEAVRHHLYVNDDGIVRDSQVEHLFDEFFHGNEHDGVTINNLRIYTKVLMDGSVTPPDDDVLTDFGKAVEWVLEFGMITLWDFTPEDVEDEDEKQLVNEHGLKYGAKIGPFDNGTYVLAKTKHLAVLLAVIQMFREFVEGVNAADVPQGSKLVH